MLTGCSTRDPKLVASILDYAALGVLGTPLYDIETLVRPWMRAAEAKHAVHPIEQKMKHLLYVFLFIRVFMVANILLKAHVHSACPVLSALQPRPVS